MYVPNMCLNACMCAGARKRLQLEKCQTFPLLSQRQEILLSFNLYPMVERLGKPLLTSVISLPYHY